MNNYRTQVELATSLRREVQAARPGLTGRLDRIRLSQPIQGFSLSDVPFWKVGYLSAERWVEEDILNLLLELCHFQRSITADFHQPLLLSTRFLADARHLYHHSPREYSRDLLSFRHYIQHEHLDFMPILFLHCLNSHTSVYIYDFTTTLHHTDSRGQSAHRDSLLVFKWLFRDLGIPTPRTLVEEVVEQQASVGQGSGSCGIAALNAAQRLAFPDVSLWRTEDSDGFRMESIEALIDYHEVATAAEGVSYYGSIPA